MKSINSLIQSGINSYSPEEFNKIPVGLDKDAIVGITKKQGNLEQSPIWGYEVQFANQQEMEMRVNALKDKWSNVLKEMTGLVVSNSKTGRKNRQSHKKIRKSAKEKCSHNMIAMEKKSAREELRMAKAGYKQTKGTPAAEVFILDIKYYSEKLKQLSA